MGDCGQQGCRSLHADDQRSPLRKIGFKHCCTQTIPPSRNACHLPLHKGGYGRSKPLPYHVKLIFAAKQKARRCRLAPLLQQYGGLLDEERFIMLISARRVHRVRLVVHRVRPFVACALDGVAPCDGALRPLQLQRLA